MKPLRVILWMAYCEVKDRLCYRRGLAGRNQCGKVRLHRAA